MPTDGTSTYIAGAVLVMVRIYDRLVTIDGPMLRKLEVLKRTLDTLLAVQPSSKVFDVKLIDPLDAEPIFQRWEALHAELCAADIELEYVPKPVAPIKHDNSTAYDRRGGYTRNQLLRLQRDVDAAWTLATHPSKQLSQVTLSREGIFTGGQPFDAMLAIGSIIRGAATSIMVIDGYISERTLNLLTMKRPTVIAKLLTHEVNPATLTHANAFVAQYGKSLEVRTSKRFHDRFVVIDDAQCYHFGASLKDAAVKNTFMFSQIEESSVIAALKAAGFTAWDEATIVQLK